MKRNGITYIMPLFQDSNVRAHLFKLWVVNLDLSMVYYLPYFPLLRASEFYIEISLLALCARVSGYLKWLFSMAGTGGSSSASNATSSGSDRKTSAWKSYPNSSSCPQLASSVSVLNRLELDQRPQWSTSIALVVFSSGSRFDAG